MLTSSAMLAKSVLEKALLWTNVFNLAGGMRLSRAKASAWSSSFSVVVRLYSIIKHGDVVHIRAPQSLILLLPQAILLAAHLSSDLLNKRIAFEILSI